MHAEIQVITPAKAKQWLAQHNTGNRRMRKWWAEALAAAMRRGEWIMTHQGIAFAKSGRLIDGQHRLEAIVKAQMAQLMLVCYDVPDEAFAVLDIGVKRSSADTTGYEKRTAEVCNLAARLIYPGNPTPTQIREVGEAGIAEVSKRLLAVCSTNCTLYSSSPLRLTACLLVMDGYDQDYVFGLYRKLVLKQFEDLPPIAYAFIRQADQKKVRSGDSHELIARGLKLLNPRLQHLQKILLKDGETQDAILRAKTILRRSMS